MLCTIPDCGKTVHGRGLCKRHYSAAKRAASPPCTFDGCGRRSEAGGLCRSHDEQRRQGAELRPILTQRPHHEPVPCAFDGCDRPSRSKGLCTGHVKQVADGRTLAPLHTRSRKPCSFDGCDRLNESLGLCKGHRSQRRRGQPLTPLGLPRGRGDRTAPPPQPREPRERKPKDTMPAGWNKPDRALRAKQAAAAADHQYGLGGVYGPIDRVPPEAAEGCRRTVLAYAANQPVGQRRSTYLTLVDMLDIA